MPITPDRDDSSLTAAPPPFGPPIQPPGLSRPSLTDAQLSAIRRICSISASDSQFAEKAYNGIVAVLTACLLLSISQTNTHAQAPNIASYNLEIYAQGVQPGIGQPISTTVFPASQITCNQPPLTVPSGTLVNPTKWGFDDAAVAGRACVGSLTSQILVGLPNAPGYTAYVTQTDNLNQVSPRSNQSNPFVKQSAAPAPTNLKIVQ